MEKWPNSTLKTRRTVAAVFASAILPLLILGFAVSWDNPAPLIHILMFGTLPALIVVCLVFLPFHIYQAHRGRPPMRRYALCGGAIGGVSVILTALVLPPWFEEPDMLIALAVQVGLALATLSIGVGGGVIFHLVAIGSAPPTTTDNGTDNKLENSG